MSCHNKECEDIIKTSEIISDVKFVNIEVPPGASTNEVLLLIEQYVNDIELTPISFDFPEENCLGVPAGTYSEVQVIEHIIRQICIIKESISSLNTNNISVSSDVDLKCLNELEVDNLTDLLNGMLELLCELVGKVDKGFVDFSKTKLPDDSIGFVTINGGDSILPDNHVIMEILGSIKKRDYGVFEAPSFNSTSFDVTIKPIVAAIGNKFIVRKDSEIITVNPSKNSFIYIHDNGTLSKIETNVSDPSNPVNPSDSTLIIKLVSDGSGVVSFSKEMPDSPTSMTFEDNSVDGKFIIDKTIDGIKLKDKHAYDINSGWDAVMQVEIDKSGLVKSVSSKIDPKGFADGDILVFDASTGGFVKGTRRSISSENKIPLSNGVDFIDSSVSEKTDVVYSQKPIEVSNDPNGDYEGDTRVGFNSVKRPILTGKFGFEEAEGLDVINGAFIYVEESGGSIFTSKGFYGGVDGAWVKFG